MKSKGGSLYEVLKSASRAPGEEAAGAPTAPDTTPVADGNQATLQERLAAYKAAKLAAANQATVQVTPAAAPAPAPKVSATTLVLEPDPTPIPPMVTPTRTVERTAVAAAPAPASVRVEADSTASAPVDPGPGARLVLVSYNTMLFGGMVVVGLLFMAYAIGLHVGKGQAAAEVAIERPVTPTPITVVTPPTPKPPAVTPPAVIIPKKEYTIRLADWKYVSAQDRVKCNQIADDPELKKALERAGHKGWDKAMITRGTEVRCNLYVDRFSDINSEAAKAALTAMKNFRWKGTTPFAQATFEEAQPH